jgi:hypothetical protein
MQRDPIMKPFCELEIYLTKQNLSARYQQCDSAGRAGYARRLRDIERLCRGGAHGAWRPAGTSMTVSQIHRDHLSLRGKGFRTGARGPGCASHFPPR